MKILIMAGGAGTRLWPFSAKAQPKQFQKLVDNRSLFQMSISRLRPTFPYKDIFVATNQDYKNLVIKQAPRILKENIILEPAKRDTAPCIALAMAKIFLKDPEATVAVLPSDHLIKKEKRLIQALNLANKFLEKNPDYLVTLGIKPTYPATGYGYIRISNLRDRKSRIYQVKSFKEKPNFKKAQRYIKSKKYFWNSGIFIWKVRTVLKEFQKFQPSIYKRLIKIRKDLGTKREKRTIEKEYPKMKKISIDYGIMEKARKVVCLPVNLGWSDVGDWAALKDILSKEEENLIKGQHLGIDTQGSLIYGGKDKLIVTLGLKNIIIINTDKALLICSKNKAQEVKKIVEKLEKRKEKRYL